MLSKWVVSTYKTLVEVALWVFLVVGGILGATIGSIVNHGLIGFLVGAVAAFFGMAVFLGAALMIGDIRQILQGIETQLRAEKH